MDIDLRGLRLQEDRTRGLSVNELCTSALGSVATDAIEVLENVEITLKSTYLHTPQMSTTYRTVFLSLLLKFRESIRYLFNVFSSSKKDTYLIGILLHTHDEGFMLLQINAHGILDVLLDEATGPSIQAEYLTKLEDALLQIESFPMIKLTMMASHANNISVLFLGALLGLEGMYYDNENFCVTSVVQYYGDAAIAQQSLIDYTFKGISGHIMKDVNIQQIVTVSKSFRLIVLRGPFIKSQCSVKMAVDVIHRLVEKFEASVVLLTGPLALEYPTDIPDYNSNEPHSLAQQYLSTFLLSLHISMLENRCHAILATDSNCLLAPDTHYPTIPHNSMLPANTISYKTILFGGDPLCVSICGVNLTYFSGALAGFQFIESSYLNNHKESISAPQVSHDKPNVSSSCSPGSPSPPVSVSTSQPSPFKRVPVLGSPVKDMSTSIPITSESSPTSVRLNEIDTESKFLYRNGNLLGLYDSLIEGRVLTPPKEINVLKGLEQKRLLYYINSTLELQTAVPEFPSSRPLLHSRVHSAWVNPESDIIITTVPAFSSPLIVTIYGRRRIIVPLLEKDGQGAVITLRQGSGTVDTLTYCETYSFVTNLSE